VSRRQIKAFVSCWLAHGWNIDIGVELNGSDLVRSLRRRGTVRVGTLRTCTLLGPEGPGRPVMGRFEPLDPFLVRPLGLAGEGTARILRTTQWTRAS
jgi:hypothetical protein